MRVEQIEERESEEEPTHEVPHRSHPVERTCRDLHRNAQTTAGVPGTMLRGGPAWEFHNVTAATGTAADRFYSHGATVADYTHDGFSDLLVYGYQGVCLVRNQGDGTFQDVTHQSGLTETPWVTAAAWGDLDGDGQLDLYLASYVLWDFQTHQICSADDGTPDVCTPTAYFGSPDSLFPGSEDGRFSDQSTRLHGNRDGKGLGAIIARLSEEVADLDNDGYLDVVITHLDAPSVILETEPPEPCHWVRVHLVGTASCRTPIGAVVGVVVGDRSMDRQLYGGGSYLSQSQPELFFHWPRGESAEAELQVQWPSGNVSQLGPVTSGQRVVVVEP